MEKKKVSGKVLRKQNRCKKILMKHENIETVDFPTKILFVGNGGLVCGIQRETLLEVFSPFGRIRDVVMLPDKPYSFVIYENEDGSQTAFSRINGEKAKDNMDLVFYLCFVKEVPKIPVLQSALPAGLHVIKDFITEVEEIELLDAIDIDSGKDAMKHRKVKHFGYEFNYSNNNVDKTCPLEDKIPSVCFKFLEELRALGHITRIPDQLTVNQYAPGQGIPPHVDTHSAFEDEIISLSLGSQVVMDFYHDGVSIPVLLPKRSVLIMKEESRYLWKHGITPRKTDVMPVFDKDGCHLTLSHRSTRVSLTFRSVRQEPCNCCFVKQCDSQALQQNQPSGEVVTEGEAIHFERQYVKQVYEDIADHFSSTRYKPWPLVSKFIDSITPGSILIDVGCGNGKNMSLNNNNYQVGCDISMNLAMLCAKRKLNIIVGDVMMLPFRDGCADVCIGIAVIHHLSTETRRLDALKEIYRLLRPGGKALIYVWALEQQNSNGMSNYLSYSKILKQKNCENDTSSDKRSLSNERNMPVHENRTNFEQQDVFVPWHKKDSAAEKESIVYHRYYHVFKKGELESLIDENIVQISSSYHDKGNWCVILEKYK